MQNFNRRFGITPATLAVLLTIFLLGLFLRVEVLARSVVEDPIRGDAVSYFFYGINLKSEGTYSHAKPRFYGGHEIRPDATVPPGFPLFVSALMSKDWQDGTQAGAEHSIRPVLLAQALLSSLLTLLVFFLARSALPVPAALGAALLTAISPHLVNINLYLLTESLFAFFFWLALFLLARGLRQVNEPLLLAAGFALACAALTRPTVQYLPFALTTLLVATRPQLWRRWAIYLGGFLILFVAWSVRNVASTGALGDPSAMAATIRHGSYPDFMFNGLPQSLGVPYRYDPVLSDHSSLRETLAVILQRVVEAPGRYLHWYLLGKPTMLFHWDILPIGTGDNRLTIAGDIYIYPTPVTPYAGDPLFVASYLLSRILYLPALLLAATASLLVWLPTLRRFWGEERVMLQMLALTFLYVVGIHMIGAPFPRYAIPFQPLLYLLAAGLLAALWRAWRRADRTIEDGAEVL